MLYFEFGTLFGLILFLSGSWLGGFSRCAHCIEYRLDRVDVCTREQIIGQPPRPERRLVELTDGGIRRSGGACPSRYA